MRYFKGKQFKQDIILIAVGYYCHFSLTYRDVSEIFKRTWNLNSPNNYHVLGS